MPVQRRPTAKVATKVMRRLLKRRGFAHDAPVTDRLRSYGAAKTELGLSARQEQGLLRNSRARATIFQFVDASRGYVQRLRSRGSAQRFLAVHAAGQNTFNIRRHLVPRNALRALRGEALQNWQAATAA